MQRLRASPAVLALVTWIASLAGLAFFHGHPRLVVPLPDWLLLGIDLLGAAALAVAIAGKLPPRMRRRQLIAVAGVAPVLVLLMALSGGPTSVAFPLLPLLALAVADRRGVRAGAVVALLLVSLLALARVALGDVDPLPGTASLALLTLAAGVVPVWYHRRTAAEALRTRRRLARVDGYLAGRRVTPTGSHAIPTDLRHDAELSLQQAEAASQIDLLDQFLRDVRDALTADEVVFWQWNEQRDSLGPIAWSTEGADQPLYFRLAEWSPFVRWAAEGRVTHSDGDDVPHLVAGPVELEGRLYGVLTISALGGLSLSRAGARDWTTRHAAQLAHLLALLEIRHDHGRQMRRMRALLGAAERLQGQTDLPLLGAAVCQTALEVTSGSRAALVRWQAGDGVGELQSVSAEHPVQPPLEIAAGSLVANACAEGSVVGLTDASTIRRGTPVYGAGERPRPVGSLAIVPLRRDDTVIGAIVVESEHVGRVTPDEVRHVEILAAVAVRSLQTVWEIEAARLHARIDQLTGLYNRRHFDEQLDRLLNEADRFGHPASLILADIDHFKQVNDQYGHEAGDAVLRLVSQVIRDSVRVVDICARYGGEEIAVLLPQTDPSGATDLAERLRRAVEAHPLAWEGGAIAVTASFGVATYPQHAAGRDAVFPAADRALYQAKEEGRNRVRCAPQVRGTTIG